MFSAKRRLIATLLVVGFLVASLGLYTEPAHAGLCDTLLHICDTATSIANAICNSTGNSHPDCLAARGIAWLACYAHYVACGGG